jgi:hypothetical protein
MSKITYHPTYGDPDQYWSTFDLGLCSSLITLKFAILHIDRENPRKARFVFKRSKKVESAVEGYFADKLLLNPRALLDNQKMVKNLLYSDI